MNLNAEQLAVLVRTLSAEEGDVNSEKRRAPRAQHPGTLNIIICRPALEGAPESTEEREHAAVRIANLSSRGIGLIHAQPMETGQRFMIQLPRQIDHHVHILCTVVHCNPWGDGLYNVGAEFTGVVPADPAARAGNKRMIAYA